MIHHTYRQGTGPEAGLHSMHPQSQQSLPNAEAGRAIEWETVLERERADSGDSGIGGGVARGGVEYRVSAVGDSKAIDGENTRLRQLLALSEKTPDVTSKASPLIVFLLALII